MEAGNETTYLSGVKMKQSQSFIFCWGGKAEGMAAISPIGYPLSPLPGLGVKLGMQHKWCDRFY